MNEHNRAFVGTRGHPGRVYLILGPLVAVAGLVIYYFQLQAKILTAPWYAPVFATMGVVLLVMALLLSRSVWRWAAVALFTLLAAAEWAMLLVFMNAPAYTGPVKPGQTFPEFATTRADGSTFNQDSLKGDQNTVMVFFRGRW
jgi:hypothetical protein